MEPVVCLPIQAKLTGFGYYTMKVRKVYPPIFTNLQIRAQKTTGVIRPSAKVASSQAPDAQRI
jgi:hypothetical protein